MALETTNIIDTVFKDDSPKGTVERIKGILQSYGIETVEKWGQSGVPFCYSLRITVAGTNFGVNGKGVTEELALASGYGELMERLQQGRILRDTQQKDGDVQGYSYQDGYATVEELLQKNKKWYTLLAERAKELTGTEIAEEDILKNCCNEDGKIPVESFYCVNSKTVEVLPSPLLGPLYGTNGGAAGNTPEEAIVQAISEIVERYVSDRVLWEEFSVPDVSEEVLSSCKTAYEIITYLRSQNFRVTVKDCSLGTKFPVVCVCLIDLKTGRYHTHFGAYPKFEIALQRTLTEAFQGRNIQKIATYENFATQKHKEFDLGNLLNQLVIGVSEKKPDFFMGATAVSEKIQEFSGETNRELLKQCIDFITEQGYDVLIQDHSCLGFPTYRVIIPGYSDVCVHRIVPEHNDVRYSKYKKKVLRNPASATREEIEGFFMNLNLVAKRKLRVGSFSRQANLPIEISAAEERFLMNAAMAYLNYEMGRHGQTVIFIEKMLAENVEKEEDKLICIKRYLLLSYEYKDENKVRSILEYFHTPEIVDWLYTAVAEKKNLLNSFVLHCDLNCDSSCPMLSVCTKKQTDALSRLIHEKSMELDRNVLKEQLENLMQ